MDGIEATRVLSAGHALLARSITRRLIREFAQRPEPDDRVRGGPLNTWSAREREVLTEVLTEVAGGWSNAETGERLRIFAATAKPHVRPADDEAGRARPGSAGHAGPRDKSGHSR